MNNILAKEQIADIRTSGKILSIALSEVISYTKPGITTMSLDEVAERSLRRQGALPSFKNYYIEGQNRFPASLCVSINDELVHGIPSSSKVLKDGDIVSLDLGANYKGMFTDMAVTVPVGKVTSADSKLISVTKNSLDEAIKFVRPGITNGDLGNFIEKFIIRSGYHVIRDLVGHGI
jgi:methionyl aminopeptidase